MVIALDLPGIVLFLLSFATFVLVFALLALGLNVHFGYTGLLNFGHVAFFAAGAYTAAILTMPPPTGSPPLNYAIGLNLPMPYGMVVSLVAAGFVGGLLAFLIGLTSVRLASHYLAIATFALASLFHTAIVNEQWLTRGPNGLNSVPKPGYTTVFSPDAWLLAYFTFTLVLTAGVYVALNRLLDAPFGRVLKGIREDETAARVLGKETNKLKLKSFVVGGAIAGVAGGVYAHYVGAIVPGQFLSIVTFLVWAMMILGGTASNRGVILGAFVVIALRDFSRFVPEVPGYPLLVTNLRWAFIGLLLIVVLYLRPQGLLGDPGEVVIEDD